MVSCKSRFIVKTIALEKYEEKFCVSRVQGGGGSIGLWGSISQNIYTGRINQYNCKETLENKLLPTARSFIGRCKNWLFQKDGTTAHTANSVK